MLRRLIARWIARLHPPAPVAAPVSAPESATDGPGGTAVSPRWRLPRWRRWAMRRDLGRFGEWVAKKHLKQLGFAIAATNVRMQRGEIDLVAVKGDLLAFVEVRTRRPHSALAPELTVDAEKQRHLLAAANEFILRRRVRAMRIRFDIIAIDVDDAGHVTRLAHYERAFDPRR